MKPARVGPGRRYLPGSPFNVPVAEEEPAETYEPHELVTHDKYGLGSVLEVEAHTAVFVDFGAQRVRLALPCAKLFKL
jgi:predicted RNA-binding protein (virulence factor B family)